MKVFERAVQYNEPLKVFQQLADIYSASEKHKVMPINSSMIKRTVYSSPCVWQEEYLFDFKKDCTYTGLACPKLPFTFWTCGCCLCLEQQMAYLCVAHFSAKLLLLSGLLNAKCTLGPMKSVFLKLQNWQLMMRKQDMSLYSKLVLSEAPHWIRYTGLMYIFYFCKYERRFPLQLFNTEFRIFGQIIE